MIQPLRQLHRHMMMALAVILPLILIAGLAVRKRFPQQNRDPLETTTFDSELSAQLKPLQSVLAPDVLVYWAPTAVDDRTLPAQARLLGSLHGIQMPHVMLPDGFLLLYSLGHQKVVAQSAFHRRGDAR